MKRWSSKEIKFLKTFYSQKGKMWCANELNRGEAAIRQKASQLGLKQDVGGKFFSEWQERARKSKIGKKNPKLSKKMKQKAEKGELWVQKNGISKSQRAAIGAAAKKRIAEKGHPKGMLGKLHTDETKKHFSKIRLGKQLNLSEKERQRRSDQAQRLITDRIANKGTIYSRSKQGWFEIDGREYYFRSTWEVTVARYFQWLKQNKEISGWKYEAETFWFENIKRGVRSYLPDFKVTNNNGKVEFYEVKGYMDSKSKTKIKRLNKYYPDVTLHVIDKDYYQTIYQNERLYPEAKPVVK